MQTFKIQGGIKMNSSGWLRSIMATNYSEEKFLVAVTDIIGKEFKQDICVIEILKGEFLITMNNYSTVISKDHIRKLKGPIGPYRLDRYILNDFRIQGFIFEKTRSQYIRYVFGIFYENEIEKEDIE